MSDRFFASIKETIDRCRRLAAVTGDHKVAKQLLELADRMESNLRKGPDTEWSNDNPPHCSDPLG